jgi:hypothetical protein
MAGERQTTKESPEKAGPEPWQTSAKSQENTFMTGGIDYSLLSHPLRLTPYP